MVTRGGSVQADLAEGLANVEAGVPCTSGTRFQLCSVSKQFAAAAVMLLAESGRLDLHEPVARWLPERAPGGTGGNECLGCVAGGVAGRAVKPGRSWRC